MASRPPVESAQLQAALDLKFRFFVPDGVRVATPGPLRPSRHRKTSAPQLAPVDANHDVVSAPVVER